MDTANVEATNSRRRSAAAKCCATQNLSLDPGFAVLFLVAMWVELPVEVQMDSIQIPFQPVELAESVGLDKFHLADWVPGWSVRQSPGQ